MIGKDESDLIILQLDNRNLLMRLSQERRSELSEANETKYKRENHQNV
jgi:hypothetical protein